MQKNKTAGAVLIFMGAFATTSQITRDKWNTPAYISVVCGIVLISIGIYAMYRTPKSGNDTK